MLMDDKELFKTILEEIKIVREELQALKIVAVQQQANLKAHMKRSDQLEAQTEIIREQLVPLSKHVQLVDAFFKILGGIAVLATIAEFILSRAH